MKKILNLLFIIGIIVTLKSGETKEYPKANDCYFEYDWGKLVKIQIVSGLTSFTKVYATYNPDVVASCQEEEKGV